MQIMKRGENKMKMNIRREWNWNDMKKRPSDCHAQINLQGFPPLALSIFISLSLSLNKVGAISRGIISRDSSDSFDHRARLRENTQQAYMHAGGGWLYVCVLVVCVFVKHPRFTILATHGNCIPT